MVTTIALDNFTLLFIYLVVILYFIYCNKTNELFIGSFSHYIFILPTCALLLGIEIGQFVTELGINPFQRAILLPFTLVFIGLLWLFRKPKGT